MQINNKVFSEGSQKNWPDEVVIYTDGASRGNPGASSLGFAVYICSDLENPIYEHAECLGTQTNNYAEYQAVIVGLNYAVKNNVKKLTLKSDSEFLVKQIQGAYKVKSQNIIPLYLKVMDLRKKFEEFYIEHIFREDNAKADRLANFALDLTHS